MSESVRIKISPDSKMVEIPIENLKHYENRVELDLVLKTHTLSRNEDESEMLAEEVVHQLVGIMKEHLANADHPYGVEIMNWGTIVHDTEEVDE